MIPGYLPWRLEQDESRLLELGLVQGIEVAQRVRDGELELTSGMEEGEPILTRCLRNGVWVEEWREPPDLEAVPDEPVPVPDELRLKRLREKAIGDDRWQIDLFRVPTPVWERNTRPYLPNMLLVVDGLGLMLNVALFEPSAKAPEIQNGMLDALVKTGPLPGELQVADDWLFRIFQPIAGALKIPLTCLDFLEDLEDAKEELLEMQRGIYQ